ncbi:MAG: PQQ-binding-like beta-propeller repeat protein [Candidatus Riflebacteria bacterium]|nr:PQQ-binding-like beta-propeller repeat protein [Candidatus Riflebacteria bacterium]
MDFARAHEQDRPRSISVLAPETPEGIANVIHRALAKRTASRPASAEEFAAAIRRSLERAAEEPAAAEATEPRPAPGAIVRDLLAGALAALAELPATLKVGIGAAALVALLFVLFHSGSASRYHGGRSSIGVDPSGAPAAPRQPTAAPSGASLPSTGPDPGSTAPETPAPERSIAAGTRPSVVTPRSPSLPEARLDPETSLGADAFRHTVDPIQIGFTADGRQVFSLDGSGTVRTLDLAGGGPPRSFSVGNDTVLVTRDLRRSIHASPTLGSLQLKDIATGAQVWTVTGLARGLTRVCRSPDDQLLLVGENDGAIRLIAVETGRVVWSVKAHGRAVAAVALSSSGTRAVSTDRGPPAASGPPRSPRASGEAVQQGYGQPQAFFTPPSTRSPSPEEDRCRVHLWDGASGHLLHFFVVPEGEATAVAVSPDGEIVAVGGTRPTFSTGDRHSNDLSSHDAPHGASPATAVVYSDDLRVYVGRASGQLDVFSATNQFAREATAETRHDGVRHLALSPDGRFVATAGPDLTLRVWQAGTVTPAVPAPGHAGKIRSIELSRDGRLIASAGHDGTVCCWEAATGRALWTFDGWAREAVHGIGFSGDGQLLALFGEEDGHVAVVVVETGTGRVRWRAAGDGRCDGVLVRFQEAGPRPMIVGLAGDGRLFTRGLHDPDPTPLRESPPQPALVTMSADGTLGLWEMADARLRLAGASGAPVVGTYPVPGGGAGLSAAERRLTALSADARFVMVAGKRALQLYRAADGRSLGKVVPGRTKAVALCPDGRAVVALAGDLLRVIDVATGQDLAWFRDVENVLDGPIAVSPDASLVLVGATNGSIQTFRLVRPPAR